MKNNMNHPRIFFAPLFCALLASQVFAADAAVSKEEKAAPFPLSASATLSNSVGQGTFLLNPGSTEGAALTNDGILDYSANPYLGSSVNLSLGLVLPLGLRLGLNQPFAMEWTKSESTTHPNQLMYGDPNLSLSFGQELLGLKMGYNAGLSLPVSMASRYNGLMTALALGASATKAIESLGLSWRNNVRLSGSVNNPAWVGLTAESGQTYEDPRLGTIAAHGCILRDESERANFACGGRPGSTRLSYGTGLSYKAPLGLTLGLTLGIGASYKNYIAPIDGYTPYWRDGDGNTQTSAGGADYSFNTNGGLSVSYSYMKWLNLTAGAASGQPLWTADTQGYRFPLWDFVSPAKNMSSFYVDLGFSF